MEALVYVLEACGAVLEALGGVLEASSSNYIVFTLDFIVCSMDFHGFTAPRAQVKLIKWGAGKHSCNHVPTSVQSSAYVL